MIRVTFRDKYLDEFSIKLCFILIPFWEGLVNSGAGRSSLLISLLFLSYAKVKPSWLILFNLDGLLFICNSLGITIDNEHGVLNRGPPVSLKTMENGPYRL